MAMDAGAAFIDEALLEPVIGGLSAWGIEKTLYSIGMPNTAAARDLAEHMGELKQI